MVKDIKNKLIKSNQPKWVSSKKVMGIQADIICILGAWSNGKSYAVKNGIIEKCWENKTKVAYVRRNDLENKDNIIENYFLDCNVEQITDGEYNGIVVYRKDIFLARYDKDSEKWEKGYHIGHGFSLSAYAHTKSGVYQNYEFMLFEEFVTTGQYLSGEFSEPYRLFRLMSTIFRNNNGKVYLVGNTITPYCPYYREWELTGLLDPKNPQKPGTIDYYHKKNESGGETVIAVYLTEPTDKKSNMFFQHEKEIHGGHYHTSEHDHVEGDITKADIIYTVVFCWEGRKFLAQFVNLDDCHFWYISPKTSEIQKNTRTIGDLRIQSNYHTKGLTPISDGERRLFEFMNSGKIRYSDNLTGSLFIQVFNKLKRYDTRFS